MSTYQQLRSLNVNGQTEKKNGLTYLSWTWAWDAFQTHVEDATYEVLKNHEGLPFFESHAGVMVFTKVTARGITHEMWLPVMDGANNAMKKDAYTYKVYDKFKKQDIEKRVSAFNIFDVNKTIMRCLTKNLAMFGLGIYIYSGEDLPPEPNRVKDVRTVEQIKRELANAARSGGDDALRVVWKTITNEDVRKSLIDYLKVLKAPKVEVVVDTLVQINDHDLEPDRN